MWRKWAWPVEGVARSVATTVSNFGFHSILAMLATQASRPPLTFGNSLVREFRVLAGREINYV